MRYLRKTIKLCIAYSLYYSGILYLLCLVKLRNRAVVLTYHRVIAAERLAQSHSTPGIIVHEKVFAAHLPVIKRFLRPLPIAQFLEHLEAGKQLPSRSCLVTFDDGWIDNYETAYPLLRQQHVPALIFLPYDYISGTAMFWQEELQLRLSRMLESQDPGDSAYVAELLGRESPSGTHIREYISALKQLGYDELDRILGQVRTRSAGIDPGGHYDRYISWEQATEMQGSVVSYGSHAISHRILTRLTAEECRQELARSRQLLETRLHSPVLTLAYPNGDHDAQVERMAHEAGYRLAFTTQRGFVHRDSPAMALPRINIHNNASSNKALFLCTILNIF